MKLTKYLAMVLAISIAMGCNAQKRKNKKCNCPTFGSVQTENKIINS